MPAEIKS